MKRRQALTRRVDPERQLHPLADLVLDEEGVVDLDGARGRARDAPRGVDHRAHRRTARSR